MNGGRRLFVRQDRQEPRLAWTGLGGGSRDGEKWEGSRHRDHTRLYGFSDNSCQLVGGRKAELWV